MKFSALSAWLYGFLLEDKRPMAKVRKTFVVPLQVVPIVEEGFHLIVAVNVNGIEVRMLLDTGASRTVFDTETLKTLNHNTELEENEDKATGLGSNMVDNFITIIDEMTIGECCINDYQVGALDLSHVNQSYAALNIEPIAGVLGSDVLVKLKAVIDLNKKVLKLVQ